MNKPFAEVFGAGLFRRRGTGLLGRPGRQKRFVPRYAEWGRVCATICRTVCHFMPNGLYMNQWVRMVPVPCYAEFYTDL